MRELIVVRACIDLQRGLPIVHMNFLGYDEQSHRRGPDSRFAHWSLKGIDNAIKRISKASRRSMRRDYDVWIYSDHGQCKVTSYQFKTGESVQAAVSRVFDHSFASQADARYGVQIRRAQMLRTPRHRPETQPPDRLPIVTCLGPLGCIYLGEHFPDAKRADLAKRLVEEAAIPLVVAKNGASQATAWTPSGCYSLPQDAASVLGANHPFLAETTADLVALSHHKDSGNFLIGGFSDGQPMLGFPIENGSHGGPSPDETSAFALVPKDIPLHPKRETLRLLHIRKAAQTFLAGRQANAPSLPPSLDESRSLRILTYNVHNCSGMDGMISPHRIAG